MPNGRAIALPIDVAEPAVAMGTGLIGGGLQKVAWEVSVPLGFIATTAMALGGIAGSLMTEGIAAAACLGLAISGATVAGWQATERFMLPAYAPERKLTEEQRQAALAAAREREALKAGRGAGLRERHLVTSHVEI